jgi:hypothetical protein
MATAASQSTALASPMPKRINNPDDKSGAK